MTELMGYELWLYMNDRGVEEERGSRLDNTEEYQGIMEYCVHTTTRDENPLAAVKRLIWATKPKPGNPTDMRQLKDSNEQPAKGLPHVS